MTTGMPISPLAGTASQLIVRVDGGTTFAIPHAVVEQGRVVGEPAAELERLIEAGDVSGFSGGVVLPYADDQAVYALPADTLIRYRLSPEAAQALPAEIEHDVTGFICGPGMWFVWVPGVDAYTPGTMRCVPLPGSFLGIISNVATAPTTPWATASWR